MADLTDIQAAGVTKIVGANSVGVEQTPVQSTTNGALHTNLRNDAGVEISSSSNGTAANQLLHTQTPDTTTAVAALGALNATVSIAMAGLHGAGFQINAGTFIGTLIPESSMDGGTSWSQTSFIDSATNSASGTYVFTASNGLKILSVVPLNGASHVRVRVSAYTSGTANALLRASLSRGASQSISTVQIVSSLPAASVLASNFINAGVTVYTSYTATQALAFKQFYAAGTGIGKQVIYRYSPSNTLFINAGDFETPADIGTTWVWTSGGTGSIASSTAQFFSGARAVQLTFSNSGGGNAQGVKQTYSSPVSYSGWRYITSQFYNTLSAGGAYTRTISIILTDSAANTRKYDVSGLSTAAPFNASGWIKITGEIENPTSSTGTGFDITQISSIELRMSDSGNKSGVVYWDTVRFEAQLTALFPIFHAANTSFNANFDPVAVLAISEQLLIGQTNNDAARKEFFALAGGVAL